MPVSVVIGGQFGSEGKGKVAQWLAREMGATAAIRVGGSNSGHTGVSRAGHVVIFRHLPTAALESDVQCVIAPGSYLDAQVLKAEVEQAGLAPGQLLVDPHAVLISDEDRQREAALRARIGSTQSGTGSAVIRRISRDGTVVFASADPWLKPYVQPVVPRLRELLDRGERVILEGTQGFGLSVLHGPDYPHVTSRDTTAAAFLAEAGLSPLDTDDIVLVLRAFPIRVPGNSGRLPEEIDWATVASEAKSGKSLVERTSVTREIRRVARFSAEIVRAAIQTNRPTRIVMNHLDYIDGAAGELLRPTKRVDAFVERVCAEIGTAVDYYGFSPESVVRATKDVPAQALRLSRGAAVEGPHL